VRTLNATAKPEETVSLTAILSKVNQARETGYSCVVRKIFPHLGSVAMKLPFNDVFEKSLVVSLAGFADNILRRENELVELMRSEIGGL
jgi:hypothetical protein